MSPSVQSLTSRAKGTVSNKPIQILERLLNCFLKLLQPKKYSNEFMVKCT